MSVLRRLGDETFGQKLRRARQESGVASRDAAELMCDEAVFVSHTSLARLEDFAEPPQDRKRRTWACLVTLVYGYDPAGFGLRVDDLPRSIDVDRFIARARALRDGDDDDGDSGSDGGGPPRGGPPSPQTPRINGLCAPVTQRTAA